MSVVDVKPYIRHHPLIGYEYVPNYEAILPQPGGGQYTLRINAAGLRSNRSYALEKPAGVKRLLVLGDSYAAGQYVSNEQRFSELLEKRCPSLEVINLGLEGTGTDQQLLIYQEIGQRYEHDAVLLMPFLQNIRRNVVDARAAIDPSTGQSVFIPKPRFELIDGRLELRNVPVPDQRLPAREGIGADEAMVRGRAWKNLLAKWPGMGMIKRFVSKIKPWEPFPEYARADHPAWQLMRAIILRLHERVQPRPLLIAPVFYVSYLRQRMARNYWQRFSELQTECPRLRLIDLLPKLASMGQEAERAFFEPHDCHYSPVGHLLLADVVQIEIKQLGLIE